MEKHENPEFIEELFFEQVKKLSQEDGNLSHSQAQLIWDNEEVEQ